tara:strand:+ start:122 stop:433 length:312 start_codon:yes stop_codon:yes gene_type:complete
VTVFVEICGEEVPVEEEVVDVWIAEFVTGWTCPKVQIHHPKGEKHRCPGDPRIWEKPIMWMGNRHYGTEHEVPFDVLKFSLFRHTMYSLRHKTTEVIEWLGGE